MKKIGKIAFPLILGAALALGVLSLYSAPAEAQVQGNCPIYTCPNNLSGWTLYGTCQYYEAATDCLFDCREYRRSNGGSRIGSRCRTTDCNFL